jgi:hypothetical protein
MIAASATSPEQFLDGLCMLALVEWYEAVLRVWHEDAAGAEAELASALDAHADALEVWRIRDAVATALHRFDRDAGRTVPRRPSARRALRVVTERAALALLVRRWLSDRALSTLYGTFEPLMAPK